MRLLSYLLLFLSAVGLFSACTPDDEKLDVSPNLQLSFRIYGDDQVTQGGDTVKFDTVFVQTGSVTKRLWVYNNHKNAVNIERIQLANASGNQYKLIINGQETDALSNVRLRGEDSLQVLVKVSIDPNNTLQPFFVKDSITFKTNGNLQHVKLLAFGQNAYFHLPGYISNCNARWDTLKPHVIYGDIGVAKNCTLNIDAGAKIYAHSGAAIYVEGTLQVNGTAQKRVQFKGDRREARYDERPGQWLGIIFAEGISTKSKIEFAEIKNAVFGVYIGANNPGPALDLEMKNCVVKNMLSHGLAAFTSNVKAENCLFTNAGEAVVGTYIGGNYQFNHCTFANYSSIFFNHDKPATRFEVRTKLSDGTFVEAPLNLTLYNSIVWGGIKDEILFVPGSGSTAMNLNVQNNIIRTEAFPDLAAQNQVSQVQDYPQFKQPFSLDFRPDSATSPALNLGVAAPDFLPVTTDVLGNARPQGGTAPDLGAFEVEDGI